MPPLPDLERAVMDVLWSADRPLTARDVQQALSDRALATTTVLTVLGRLERKGLVSRAKAGRAYQYRPRSSREEHIAELMRDVLDAAPDRAAALASFLGTVPPDDRKTLRDLLR
ncbi:BlaI/MecI/CopY family transcriptional regulator [Thermocrispum agreste]|uniref:Transcriptional regulator n=1 Tax=Thermocrispum agreste TaxID=37925 RepID=A0A2W4JB64_9PSEU|nr:BlaI/MecI/CopY family transcriptional regulator [Thermocrispum agreste]PZM96512.1 MAG: transcriptional regulator [Thermocrispum agreste]